MSEECKSLPEVAEAIIQVKELLRSPEVVNGGDKRKMCNDLLVEAEGELAIGRVTHCLLLAPGFDDPEHSQCTGLENLQINLLDQEDDDMDAERRRHP